jgi:hypothetical protein
MNAVSKFIHREPRYVIRPTDSKLIKFAPVKKGNWIRTTEVVNISKTGIAFIVYKEPYPAIREVVKIEFHLPVSDEPVAWFGRVVRLQKLPEDSDKNTERVLVAVNFENLPEGHKAAVAKSLKQAFGEIQKQQALRRRKRWKGWIKEYFGRFALVVGALIIFFAAMYFLTRSGESYNPEVPTAWGERSFKTDSTPDQ